MIYLFLGQDPLSKDAQLKAIKKEFLSPQTEQFNFDLLYARDLSLKELQEKLLCLPVKSPKRILLIKEAQLLKDELKDFILTYTKKPHKDIVLVLDVNKQEKREKFIELMLRQAKVFRFREAVPADAFSLSRLIAAKRTENAVRVLNQLLKEGERPERILGGLRYVWEKDNAHPAELRRGLKLLLDCDIDIKTGKLKPDFALERLVISLCGFREPLH